MTVEQKPSVSRRDFLKIAALPPFFLPAFEKLRNLIEPNQLPTPEIIEKAESERTFLTRILNSHLGPDESRQIPTIDVRIWKNSSWLRSTTYRPRENETYAVGNGDVVIFHPFSYSDENSNHNAAVLIHQPGLGGNSSESQEQTIRLVARLNEKHGKDGSLSWVDKETGVTIVTVPDAFDENKGLKSDLKPQLNISKNPKKENFVPLSDRFYGIPSGFLVEEITVSFADEANPQIKGTRTQNLELPFEISGK